MTFQLPELHFAYDQLEPHMSERTVAAHHGKHHAGYIEKLNEAVQDTSWAGRELRDIIRESHGKPELSAIYNNAAQAWNHAFFWLGLTPRGGGDPGGELATRIGRDFGSIDAFRGHFRSVASGFFGSGWAWLVLSSGKLEVMATSNADTPIAHGLHPLLTLDLWEHAHYLDTLNERGTYIDSWFDHLVDWEFASNNLEDAGESNWKVNRYREVREAFAESGLGD